VDTADVVIAGAGIIGLSIALDLACRGIGVVVLERGRAMAESSYAAAGMLAVCDPENPTALAELAHHSQTLYPDYLAVIERLSGKRIPLRTSATIQALHAYDDAGPIGEGRLSHDELLALVPELQSNRREFCVLEEQSLDPRDLCTALPLAARAAGVDLREEMPVLAVEPYPGGVRIYTNAGGITASHFINAAGAWAEDPALCQTADMPTRITPRKGQMAALRLRGPAELRHVLRTSDIYLVPRGNGTVIVGATVEDAGFDKSVEPCAIAALIQTAAALWPPIAHAEIVETWAGLRPGSIDTLPLLGPVDAAGRQYLAAGHFRNGILLAPATARAISRAVRGLAPEIDLSPFDPHRFRPIDRSVPSPSDNAATAAL
jgi:glycine oxidase